jgi:hypothetical protein
VTRRTTIQNYDADLEAARALFDERTGFAFTVHHEPEVDAEIQKRIADALNNEWQRGITIDAWVERVLTEMGIGGRRSIRQWRHA